MSAPRSNERSKRILAALLILVVVVNLFGMVGLTLAAACGSYDCADQSDFSTNDLNGWDAAGTSMTVQWTGNIAFGWPPFKSSADGVMAVRYLGSPAEGSGAAYPALAKTIYLQPGLYQVVFRAATDVERWDPKTSPNIIVNANGIFGMAAGTIGVWDNTVKKTFVTFTTDVFTITSASSAQFTIGARNIGAATFLVDYIWIVRTADYTVGEGTPTPIGPSGQATPIPSATPYCITSATPTPTPDVPAFSLTPTMTPTPTPSGPELWQVFDTFEVTIGSNWTRTGSGVRWTAVPRFQTGVDGSAFIPYSSGAFSSRSALVYHPATPITSTTYVDTWAQVFMVPVGETAHIQVWVLDVDTSSWTQVSDDQLSAQNWYPHHDTMTEATGGTAAIAFTATRSDNPGGGDGVYLDSVYLYGDLSMAPHCDQIFNNAVPPVDAGNGVGLKWPIDKPCPQNLNVPNNFWGGLLANLTLFLDSVFAFSPLHQHLGISDMIGDLISGPIFFQVRLYAMFFDLRIPLLALIAIIGINAAETIYSVWIKIKDAIPFL